MNKKQELWLRMADWKETTERWDNSMKRWSKDDKEIRIYNGDDRAFINGFDAVSNDDFEESLKVVQTLNRMRKENVR